MKKKKNCYLFIFDGYSDWEVAYASAGIGKSEDFRLKTIAFHMDPVKSMGGLSVMPDMDFLEEVDLSDIDADNTGMLILPGGSAWEEKRNDAIAPLVAHCLLNGIPVAAICGATVFLADLGLLNRAEHTSNDVNYLYAYSPAYRGRNLYRMEPSVMTASLITAAGTSAVEFAGSIFERLDIKGQDKLSDWFQYFEKELA